MYDVLTKQNIYFTKNLIKNIKKGMQGNHSIFIYSLFSKAGSLVQLELFEVLVYLLL